MQEPVIYKDIRDSDIPVYKEGIFPNHQSVDGSLRFTVCCPPKRIVEPEQYFRYTDPPSPIVPGDYVSLDNVEIILQPENDRRQLVRDTTVDPFKYQGLLHLTFPGGSGNGTGIIIGPHHVLTAGHNLYNTSCGGWVTEAIFYPGRDDTLNNKLPFGSARGKIFAVPREWTHNINRDYDFGVIILDFCIGYRTGWCGFASITDEMLKKSVLNVTGYPGDKIDASRGKAQMWTMESKCGDLNPELVAYDIDTYKGQSGAGVWGEWDELQGHQVVGVHVSGPREGLSGNIATRITPQKFEIILEALTKYQTVDFAHPMKNEKVINRVKKEINFDPKPMQKQHCLTDSRDNIKVEISSKRKRKPWYEEEIKENIENKMPTIGISCLKEKETKLEDTSKKRKRKSKTSDNKERTKKKRRVSKGECISCNEEYKLVRLRNSPRYLIQMCDNDCIPKWGKCIPPLDIEHYTKEKLIQEAKYIKLPYSRKTKQELLDAIKRSYKEKNLNY